jgi:hypothetical protein
MDPLSRLSDASQLPLPSSNDRMDPPRKKPRSAASAAFHQHSQQQQLLQQPQSTLPVSLQHPSNQRAISPTKWLVWEAACESLIPHLTHCGLHALASLLSVPNATSLTSTSSSSSTLKEYSKKQSTLSLLQQQQMQASQSLASSSSSLPNAGASSSTTSSKYPPFLPSITHITHTAQKLCQETPPWIHWSKTDGAAASSSSSAVVLVNTSVTNSHTLSTSTAFLQGIHTLYNSSSNTNSLTSGTHSHALFFLDSATRTCIQGKRTGGYRMARATVGVSPATTAAASTTTVPHIGYYWEARVLPGPSCGEILQALPSQVRLAKHLQRQLEQGLAYETSQLKPPPPSTTASYRSQSAKERRTSPVPMTTMSTSSKQPPVRVGGQVRIGWSLRTAEAHAPVGYDAYSYGIRSLGGARVHNSQRWEEDEEDPQERIDFLPGDVIGCAIVVEPQVDTYATTMTTTASVTGSSSLLLSGSNPSSSAASMPSSQASTSHIRFFHNGRNVGPMEVRKGKRHGGEAFFIESGTYYPAFSAYLGGGIQANFGPHFLYPPKPLPTGLKLQPMSTRMAIPMTPDEAVAYMTPILQSIGFPTLSSNSSNSTASRTEWLHAWTLAIQAEATVWRQAYDRYSTQQLEDVHAARQARHMSVADLPPLHMDPLNDSSIHATGTTSTTVSNKKDTVMVDPDATQDVDLQSEPESSEHGGLY